MYELAEVYGVIGCILYVLGGCETYIKWGKAVRKKRYHLFWYLVFLPVTLSFSLCEWLYDFMTKDL